jgi:hypothetical protein
VDKHTLLSVNAEQLASTKWPAGPKVPGEFKKLVYDSKFTKPAEGMSFVNSPPSTFSGLTKQDFWGSGEGILFPLVPWKSHLT